MKRVAVIDYGIGNLFSVCRAFEKMGAEPFLAKTPNEIRHADRLVLPGVGAFEDGMQGLRERSFVEPILEFAALGRPFLGICLGMQMMLSKSYEFGEHRGLGLIAGEVRRIPENSSTGERLKVPHIGWNALVSVEGGRPWQDTLLRTTAEKSAVYFVHSFEAIPSATEHRLAEVHYGGKPITAAVASGSLMGVQFHPERSGPLGLNMIGEFLNL